MIVLLVLVGHVSTFVHLLFESCFQFYKLVSPIAHLYTFSSIDFKGWILDRIIKAADHIAFFTF